MSATPRIAIRADAGPMLGTGHFARASAVAGALSTSGDAEIVLVTGEEGTALVPAFFPPGTKVLPLHGDDCGPEAAMQALRERGWTPDVIFLDQYGEVPQWEALAARGGFRLLVIDDLDAARQADVIVRPHGGAGGEAGGITLRGPAYLPLSRHVTALAARRPRGDNARLRLNVCFGGSDPTGETAKALEALASARGLDVDIVIGPGARVDAGLAEAAGRPDHVTLHRAPSQERLAALMGNADLALGAGGVMLWERMHLGILSLVVSAAANQRPQIDAMTAAGTIRFIGDCAQVTPETIAAAVTALAADAAARAAMAEAGRALVDGRGAARIAAWLRALALGSRDVTARDAPDLLAWRTHESNWRHNWDDAQKPGLEAHVAWLAAKLADPACVFRIVTLAGEPAGVVRFDFGDGGASAHLSIYLVPALHGRRLGLPVYCAAERALRRSHPGVARIVSRIHSANAASLRLHLDAGFSVSPSKDRADWLDARKAL